MKVLDFQAITNQLCKEHFMALLVSCLIEITLLSHVYHYGLLIFSLDTGRFLLTVSLPRTYL